MKTAFFTGHRTFNYDKEVFDKLKDLLIRLAKEGVTDFYAGGAQGWDMMFELAVLKLRDYHVPFLKLHMVLPCPPEEQTAKWNQSDKNTYKKILEAADSVEIVSEHYDKNCMKKRNQRLVELGDICVCYYNVNKTRSGTGQTVRFAEKQEKEVINILEL